MVGRLERNKDLVQDLVENTAHRVGSIASIITGAVVDVTREIGDLVTDGFEMREASKKAAQDGRSPSSLPESPSSPPELVEGSDSPSSPPELAEGSDSPPESSDPPPELVEGSTPATTTTDDDA